MGKSKHGHSQHYDIQEQNARGPIGASRFASDKERLDWYYKISQINKKENEEDAAMVADDEYTAQVKVVNKNLKELQKKYYQSLSKGEKDVFYWKWQAYVNKFDSSSPLSIAHSIVDARQRIAEFYDAGTMINEALKPSGDYNKAADLAIPQMEAKIGSVKRS